MMNIVHNIKRARLFNCVWVTIEFRPFSIKAHNPIWIYQNNLITPKWNIKKTQNIIFI